MLLLHYEEINDLVIKYTAHRWRTHLIKAKGLFVYPNPVFSIQGVVKQTTPFDSISTLYADLCPISNLQQVALCTTRPVMCSGMTALACVLRCLPCYSVDKSLSQSCPKPATVYCSRVSDGPQVCTPGIEGVSSTASFGQ